MICTVSLHDRQETAIGSDKVPVIVRMVWQEEGKNDAEIDVILLDEASLLELNKSFLNRSYLTDVIAFELSENSDEIFAGEIYISVDRIIENAAEFKVRPEVELLRVATHATLHFLGYRDKTPEQRLAMSEREDFYLRSFV